MTPEVLIMSKRAWDGLAPDDQTIFKEAARESSRFMREQWQAWEERSRRQAQDGGSSIIADVDKAPFEAAMAEVYAKALSGAKISDLVERIRQVR